MSKRLTKAKADHEKFLERMGVSKKQLSKRKRSRPSVAAKPKPVVTRVEHIPSVDDFAPATKREPNVYSGERKLLGIATMHKSNLVPVFDEQNAKDIARMRR